MTPSATPVATSLLQTTDKLSLNQNALSLGIRTGFLYFFLSGNLVSIARSKSLILAPAGQTGSGDSSSQAHQAQVYVSNFIFGQDLNVQLQAWYLWTTASRIISRLDPIIIESHTFFKIQQCVNLWLLCMNLYHFFWRIFHMFYLDMLNGII